MHARLMQRMWWGLALGLILLFVAAGAVTAARRAASAVPESGIVCTTNPSATFTLTTKTGFIGTPDGNTIFMWSYVPGDDPFQFPGPTLCVNQGDTVTIVLLNTLPEDASILFPGQVGVLANGAPAQPQFTGPTLTSLTDVAAALGGSVTYSFVAGEPGTYLYLSGTNPTKQVQMGLYGALVVRPTGQPSRAYLRPDSEFNPVTEYVMLLSEVDPALHQAVERGEAYDITLYHPRYWLINGRAFPDTIAPNGANWLPTQPYGSLVHMHPKSGANPLPALVRYLNAGSINHPFHPHGNHGRVIARDGRPLEGPTGQDLSFEKFTVTVGSGQTWDATYDWTDIEGWNPNSNPIPVVVPQPQNLQFKDNATWYSGSPYLGFQSNLPPGVTSFNLCGEYYHMWHSHALHEAANFEAAGGGMMTFQRIDPPLPNTCP